MINFKNSVFLAIAGMVLTISACKKNEIVTPSYAEFVGRGTGTTLVSNYFVTADPNTHFTIPVGITNFSDKARTINYTVSSPTGAVAGQQYTVAGNSVTIPAGKVLDSIIVKGIFAGYPTGRKDTLVITINGGDAPIANYNNVYKLVMQKFCPVDLNTLVGNYTNTVDRQSPDVWGPYTSSITAVSTGPTSAQLLIKNFGAGAFGPFIASDAAANPGIKVNIDFSDPANFKTTMVTQKFYDDPTYGPATIKASASSGSFSSCENTFTINFTVTVAAGSFGDFTTKIAR